MKPGSVIIDVSVDQAQLRSDRGRRVTVKHGSLSVGSGTSPAMPVDSSWLYANNVLHYVKNLFKKKGDTPDLDDEHRAQSLVTLQGKIVHQAPESHGVHRALEGVPSPLKALKGPAPLERLG